ncbi:MAG: signal peptidase I [Phycisphaera sp.]|nr:MAG: signal peptidase I [Phycisphaera sp.]
MAGAIFGIIIGLIYIAVLVVVVMGFWKMFKKAGQPGWAAIVPIYNIYVLCKVAGRPGWWLLLMLIPIVGIVISIMVSIDISKSFGKGTGFAIGLILLGFIFYPILGFGKAEYQGPAAAAA